MTICLFLFLLNLCQIFFLMNIERLRNREKRKCKIYSRLSRVRDATKDRLIVPSLDSTKHNCTIERVTIANDSRGPDTDTQHITKRMSPEPLETFGTIDLNQLLAPFRIANWKEQTFILIFRVEQKKKKGKKRKYKTKRSIYNPKPFLPFTSTL